MDQERFDRLTRTFATKQSRRGVLKGLAGTAVGGLLVSMGIGEAAAKPPTKPSKCYGERSSCTNGKQCCSGTCTNRMCAAEVPVDPCATITCVATSECFTPGGCSDGVCSPETPKAVGASCSAGTCDGAGTCAPVDPCAGITCIATSECFTPGNCSGGVCSPQTPNAPGTPCSTGFCDGAGVCETPEVCTLPLNAPCESADQCCENGAEVACGPIGNLGLAECCRPFGAACTNPGDWTECCAVVAGGSLVFCSPTGTCGGLGAECFNSSTCAPGLTCQSDFGPFGQCVAV